MTVVISCYPYRKAKQHILPCATGMSMLMISLLRAKFFRGKMNIYLHLCHSSTFIWHRYLKSFLKQEKDLYIVYIQYHGCWCPGDVRSQGSNSHDIDLGKPGKLGPPTLRVLSVLAIVNCNIFCGIINNWNDNSHIQQRTVDVYMIRIYGSIGRSLHSIPLCCVQNIGDSLYEMNTY